MTYFKKFTDFLGALGLFFALLSLTGKYMSFDFGQTEELSVTEKLKIFFDVKGTFTAFALFALLLGFYLLVSRIFAKIAVVSLFASLLPVSLAITMLLGDDFYSHPFFYLIISALGFFGAVFDVISYDRQNTKRHLFWTTALVGIVFFALIILISKLPTANLLPTEDESLRADRLMLIGIDLFSEVSPEEIKVANILAVGMAISVAVSLVLREIYFIDLIFSLALLGFAALKWYGGVISFADSYICFFVLVYFLLRLALFFFEVQKRE